MSTISAGTTTGTALVSTGDTTGALVIKTGASNTTAMTIGADQSVTFAGTVTGVTAGFSAMQVFTSSGTFTIPSGKTVIKVTVVGGGGGGDGVDTSAAYSGSAGGFSRLASGRKQSRRLPQTGAALRSVPAQYGGDGGTASGGTLNSTGSGGGAGVYPGQGANASGTGGSSFLGGGAASVMVNPPVAGNPGTNYGGGGSGATRFTSSQGGSGGGGGGTAISYLTGLTPGNTLAVTVGSGGAGGTGGTHAGGAGFAGVVFIEY